MSILELDEMFSKCGTTIYVRKGVLRGFNFL